MTVGATEKAGLSRRARVEPSEPFPGARRLAPWAVGALVVGAALRLVLPGDIVYLADEKWMFEHVQSIRRGATWAVLGEASSTGIKNAPMSLWAFVILGALGRVQSPPDLARAVALLAIAGHLAMWVIVLRLASKREERAAWAWAFLLTMTNPTLVFLERKIWAQSLLPALEIAMLCAWMRRELRIGSLLWGLLGALAGQIHMAGYFFTASLALFTRMLDARARARWGAWFLGTGLGAIAAVPWLVYIARERPAPSPTPWWLRFRLEFYQYFFSDPSAMCLPYILGDDTVAAMRYPLVCGRPTYLVAAAYVALGVASAAIALRAVRYGWKARSDLRGLLLGDRSDTAIALAAALLGTGVLMTLPSLSVYRHYLLAVFPLPYVWTARAALRRPGGEKWLATLCAGGVAMCLGALAFVASKGGADEFGKTWAAQVRDGTSTDDAKRFRRTAR